MRLRTVYSLLFGTIACIGFWIPTAHAIPPGSQPYRAVPPTSCCVCQQDNNTWCVKLSGITSCANFTNATDIQSIHQSSPDRLQGFNCTGTQPLTTEQCATTPSGTNTGRGQCPSTPIESGALTNVLRQPAAAGSGEESGSSTTRAPLLPELSVPIPGLTLAPADEAGGCTPWLAQYISAIYRYLLTLGTITAVVMVVYGGFRYIVGATYGDIKRGREIITDAVMGLIIAFGAYVILYTINPETVTLNSICVSGVTGVQYQLPDYDNETQAELTMTSSMASGHRIRSSTPSSYCPSGDHSAPTSQPVDSVSVRRPTRAYRSTVRGGHWFTGAGNIQGLVRTQNGAWVGDCPGANSDGGGSHPDSVCASLAGWVGGPAPPAGQFGWFLRAMTGNCTSKIMTYLDGLDGLTYGLENATIDNMPGWLAMFAEADMSKFREIFGSTQMSRWFQNNQISSDALYQLSIENHGLFCAPGFAQALRRAGCVPAFQRAQLKYIFDSQYVARVNRGQGTYFTTAYGKIMWAVLQHNPGPEHCRTVATLTQGCPNTNTDAGKIRCILGTMTSTPDGRVAYTPGTFETKGCRNGPRSAAGRVHTILQILEGFDMNTPYQQQSWADVERLIRY